jgi:hypothetical protein
MEDRLTKEIVVNRIRGCFRRSTYSLIMIVICTLEIFYSKRGFTTWVLGGVDILLCFSVMGSMAIVKNLEKHLDTTN